MEAALKAAKFYLDAVETCHICEGAVLVDSGPTNCEDCSADCDTHDASNCEHLDVLHAAAKRKIDRFLEPK